MSENNSKKNKSNASALIATIIVAVLAVAAVIVLMVMFFSDSSQTLPDGTKVTFKATQEQIDDALYSAHDLVSSNYETVRLYIKQGLPHLDEPYGNEPEDGIYTVDSDKYQSVEDMQSFLRSVYTEQAANDIWERGVYKARYLKNGLAYTGDDITAAGVETVLGISSDFTPQEDYATDWSSSPIEVFLSGEEECEIVIYVNGASPEDESVDSANIIQTKMVKENGEWRLTEFVS